MLPRTEFEMAEHIRDFMLAFRAKLSSVAARCTSILRLRAKYGLLARRPEAKSRGIGRPSSNARSRGPRMRAAHDLRIHLCHRLFEKLGFEVERGNFR